jgi:hypothetical protein
MNTETTQNKKIDQAQIDAWKKLYDNVFKLSVGGKVCFVRSVDRKIMSYVSQLAKDPIKYNEALLESCWLGGDTEIKTNDSLFISVMDKLADLMDFQESELEKL